MGRFGIGNSACFGARAAIGLVALVVAAGCQHTAAPDGPFTTPGWEEHRLPNTAHPYEKLLVEIDAVAGTEPSAAEVAELRAFLEQATHKPGGITVKVDNIIPKAVARQRSAQALALEYLNGPADENTAFIYVLCYRSRLQHFFAKPENPSFSYFPYPCAVWINRSYALFFNLFYPRTWRRAILAHEVGHALGLARNPQHSERGHCANAGCLMQAGLTFRMTKLLRGRNPWENTELCAECRADLESYKVAEVKNTDRMWHGYFMRRGEGYQMLTLPGFAFVNFGDDDAIAPDAMAERRHAKLAEADAGDSMSYSTKVDLPEQAEIFARFVAEQKQTGEFRELARKLFEECLRVAEAELADDPEKARVYATDSMIAAAVEFPELQAKMKAFRDKVDRIAPAGSDR